MRVARNAMSGEALPGTRRPRFVVKILTNHGPVEKTPDRDRHHIYQVVTSLSATRKRRAT